MFTALIVLKNNVISNDYNKFQLAKDSYCAYVRGAHILYSVTNR